MYNLEAWAEVIEDVLHLVPMEHRSAVLAIASKNEDEHRKRRGDKGFEIISAANMKDWKDSPGFLHWNAIMRLESLVVQVFVRHITNNNSPKDAAQLLFAEQDHGSGSGRLGDYLDDLPRPPH